MREFVILVAIYFSQFCNAQETSGVKPGISINGYPCLIQNLIYSCVPRTCDSIVIMAGDSIEFCTYQQIFLNTDSAYWLRWHFYGATNLPDTILNDYPSQTPQCYFPLWDSAGTFIVEVFYNGVLSAYPTSDCYQQGPSHWFVKVVVLPNPNGIEEHIQSDLQVAPNPSSGVFTFDIATDGKCEIVVYDSVGKLILRTHQNQIDLSPFGKGIYTALMTSDGEVYTRKLIVQ